MIKVGEGAQGGLEDITDGEGQIWAWLCFPLRCRSVVGLGECWQQRDQQKQERCYL